MQEKYKSLTDSKWQARVDTMGLNWGVLVHGANGSDSLFGGVLMIELKSILTNK